MRNFLVFNITFFLICIIFFSFLAKAQTININVEESLRFSIENKKIEKEKNFFSYSISLYNTGSIPIKARLRIKAPFFDIHSEIFNILPSEEKNLELHYLSLQNETIDVFLEAENLSIPLYREKIEFNSSLEETKRSLDYILTDSKIKILGDLDSFFFYFLGLNSTQKKLKGFYNEILLENFRGKDIKVVFFNRTHYFLWKFENRRISIFDFLRFELKKTIALAFLT